MSDAPEIEAEKEPETEYEKTRRNAFLQLFRVITVLSALIAKTLPAIFGLFIAVFADIAINQSLTVAVAGTNLPILYLAKAAFTIEILRGVVLVAIASDPELRKIDP